MPKGRFKKFLEFMLYTPAEGVERATIKRVIGIPGYDKFVLKMKPTGEMVDQASCQEAAEKFYQFLRDSDLPGGLYEGLKSRMILEGLEAYTLDELNRMYYPVSQERGIEDNIRKGYMRKIFEEAIARKGQGTNLVDHLETYSGKGLADKDLPNSRGEPEEEITGP